MLKRTSPAGLRDLGGRSIPVRVRANRMARRIILQIDRDNDGVILTLPKWAKESDALALLEERAEWVCAHLDALPARVPFVDGTAVPYLGECYTLRHDPSSRGIAREGGQIRISGRPEHLPRRYTDWLRRQAKAEITSRAHPLAERIGVRVRRITVRDTKSRWGSCSSGGNLSFSWRLVMAPEWIMDYVVAHEVAHLRHANHGPTFWALVAELCSDPKAARTWLNKNAQRLHRIG
ncbi:MAG: SprT family zinc-dependent metalloprotease [Pseudomonadota bacterium]|nr:SprT family zinc-dependent metalloprotease [Pseudomonadota bacterium]